MHQFGFLPNESTTMQLIYLADRWLKAIESGERTLAIFLDFMKEFYREWHEELLSKLCQLGLAPGSWNWIRSYQSERSISVRMKSSVSTARTVNAGVPLGSHLFL